MPLTLRFVLPLLVVLAGFAYAVVPLMDQLSLRWSIRDLESRSALIANTVQEPLRNLLQEGSQREVVNLFNRITQDERLFAMGYCASPEAKIVATPRLPEEIRCADLARYTTRGTNLLDQTRGALHVTVKPMPDEPGTAGQLVLVHDMSFLELRSEETKRYAFYFFTGLAVMISLITVVVAHLSWRGWVQGIRSLLRGEGILADPNAPIHAPEFRPLARDFERLIQDLELERRTKDEALLTWTPATLRSILRGELRGDDVIVVSNREPYMHIHKDGEIVTQRPASGLVTALEPVMRACSGTWVAHGSGSADRETVDRRDHVYVPPDRPAYVIRRVWLTPEEESGYYFGFSNEGLWPLCHIAHVRPTFRSSDWSHYVEVNRRFARAVVQEAKTPDPIVLVQDYHFALLPRMIREQLPYATVITFWHIPWPNPESFAICPWREEIIDGLLGSSILGFHTQFHCNNFVDTVDRFMEARVDRESFSVSLGGKETAVRRYPISIDWPPDAELTGKPVALCRLAVREANRLPERHAIGIGVDRLDYTKGIIERFNAVERLLELHPEWLGRFSFIQIAAPSRSRIGEYQAHEAFVQATADRINARFAGQGPPPILLKIEHHDAREVYEYYRAADLCFVGSLHDGMNLVAKEFVAARDDERGVLVLSQFTGAARDLPEALIVNPYDADQCAAALHSALTMPGAEQLNRMRLMRVLVAEFNVYRWAGRMLRDASAMRRRGRVLEQSNGVVRLPRVASGL